MSGWVLDIEEKHKGDVVIVKFMIKQDGKSVKAWSRTTTEKQLKQLVEVETKRAKEFALNWGRVKKYTIPLEVK